MMWNTFAWSVFKSSIQEASKSLPILPDNKPAEWMTDELLNLSRKKCDAWMLLRNKDPKINNPKLQEEYKWLCKLTKVAAEKARNAWWSERAAEAKKRAWFAEQLGQGGSFLKELRLLNRQVSRPAVTPLPAKDSSHITDDEGKLRGWAEHFTEVFNSESLVSEAALDTLPVISCPNSSQDDIDSHLGAPLSEEEISLAISQLKSGKAPGIDDITAEFLKLGGGTTVQWLSSLFTSIWNHGTVPSDWRKRLIIPLHKKGSRTECDNYRGIALLSIPSKVFTRVSLNRLKPKAEAFLRESQCGFR